MIIGLFMRVEIRTGTQLRVTKPEICKYIDLNKKKGHKGIMLSSFVASVEQRVEII